MLSESLNYHGWIKIYVQSEYIHYVFTDDYWGHMFEQVIGQFNLGFIICKLDKDLFIVDQVISNILPLINNSYKCIF